MLRETGKIPGDLTVRLQGENEFLSNHRASRFSIVISTELSLSR